MLASLPVARVGQDGLAESAWCLRSLASLGPFGLLEQNAPADCVRGDENEVGRVSHSARLGSARLDSTSGQLQAALRSFPPPPGPTLPLTRPTRTDWVVLHHGQLVGEAQPARRVDVASACCRHKSRDDDAVGAKGREDCISRCALPSIASASWRSRSQLLHAPRLCPHCHAVLSSTSALPLSWPRLTQARVCGMRDERATDGDGGRKEARKEASKQDAV